MVARYQKPERFRHWQGQALRHADFNAWMDSADQARWWHNRAAHAAFGVAFGLTVDDEFTVTCGIAYNCFGQELVIPENRGVPPVNVSDEEYLEFTTSGLGWISPADATRTNGVLLAHQRNGRRDPNFRPLSVRGLRRPRLAAGATPPDNTPWQIVRNDDGTPVGLQVTIDTSAAGFTQTPLYLASLVWSNPNTKFTPPYTNIAAAEPESLTVRLLLQGIGEEALALVQDIPTVTSAGWTSQTAAPLLDSDVTARLIPRVGNAIHINSVPKATPGLLNLAADPASASLSKGGKVALVSFALEDKTANSMPVISVDDSGAFAGAAGVLREGPATPGAAAVVETILDGTRFVTKTRIPGLAKNATVDPIGTGGVVKKVAPDNVTVTFTAATNIAKGFTVIRTSRDLSQEVPVLVENLVNNDGSIIRLSTPIPDLKTDDILGMASTGHTVVAVSESIQVDTPAAYRKGDIVRNGPLAVAIVTDAVGNLLLIDRPLTGGGPLETGMYGARSTILGIGAGAPTLTVGNATLFARNDVLGLLTGAAPGVSALANVEAVPGANLLLDNPLNRAAKGDVVTAMRFATRSEVTSDGKADPIDVANGAVFRVGDLVAVRANPSFGCRRITGISDNQITFGEGGPVIPRGSILEVIYVETVASVTDATATSITVTTEANVRAGWYAGHVDRWLDATGPVVLKTAWPDGTLPGDSVGLAALTPSQPTTRFADASTLPPFLWVNVAGTDENTLLPVNGFGSAVPQTGTQEATLVFSDAVAYTLRPEETTVASVFDSNIADDFAVYARRQGLCVCWLGCALPPDPNTACPGIQSPCNQTGTPCGCQQ